MAAISFAAVLAILLLLGQSCSASANFILPSFLGNACTENVCGKGKCVASANASFGFECECEPEWKQARSHDDQHFKFLPCVIPNCTLNYTCAEAPAPMPDNHTRANLSFFDPCYWADCGGGSCNKTSRFTRTCECEEGYYNLLNSIAFPCYKKCAIGMDCARLGLTFMNSSSNSSPPTAVDSESHAASLIPRVEFGWLIGMVITLALVARDNL